MKERQAVMMAALALATGASLVLAGCPSENSEPSSSEEPSTAASTDVSAPASVAVASASSKAEQASSAPGQYNLDALKGKDATYDPRTDTLTVTGNGRPPRHAKTPAQGRLLAERAAKAVAMRSLLSGYAALTGNQVPDSRVEGFVTHMHEVSQNHNPDGSVTVTMTIKTKDIQLQ